MVKLNADRPFIGAYAIEANVYKGIPRIKTYGNYSGAIIRADIPQELQYKIIKAIYEHWSEFLAAFPLYKQYPDPLKITATEPVIPLAAGTVQYLEEKGYSVAQKLIPPEYKKK